MRSNGVSSCHQRKCFFFFFFNLWLSGYKVSCFAVAVLPSHYSLNTDSKSMGPINRGWHLWTGSQRELISGICCNTSKRDNRNAVSHRRILAMVTSNVSRHMPESVSSSSCLYSAVMILSKSFCEFRASRQNKGNNGYTCTWFFSRTRQR